MQHSIEYVVCKCGHYYKLDDEELTMRCVHCSKSMVCDLNFSESNVSAPCENCELARNYKKEYRDIYDMDIEGWIRDVAAPRTRLLNGIADCITSDPELVAKLIQDIIYLEAVISKLSTGHKIKDDKQHGDRKKEVRVQSPNGKPSD